MVKAMPQMMAPCTQHHSPVSKPPGPLALISATAGRPMQHDPPCSHHAKRCTVCIIPHAVVQLDISSNLPKNGSNATPFECFHRV